MDKALSDSDLSKEGLNVILYENLKNFTAEDILRILPVAILYQVEPDVGHWTLLMEVPGGVEFFDPYGIVVDKQFDYLEMKQPHYLAKLLYDLSKKIEIHYNPYEFQSREPGINTCGRWVILRSKFPKWNIDKFKDVVNEVKNGNSDKFVTSLFYN